MRLLIILVVLVLVIVGCDDNLIPIAKTANSPQIDPPPPTKYNIVIKNQSEYVIDIGQNYQLIGPLLQDQQEIYDNLLGEVAWNVWYPNGTVYRFDTNRELTVYINEYQVVDANLYPFTIQNHKNETVWIGSCLPNISWKSLGYIRKNETETYGSNVGLQQWRADGPFYWWIDMPADEGCTYIVDDNGVTKIQ